MSTKSVVGYGIFIHPHVLILIPFQDFIERNPDVTRVHFSLFSSNRLFKSEMESGKTEYGSYNLFVYSSFYSKTIF